MMTDDMVRDATTFTDATPSSRAAAELSEAIDILRSNLMSLTDRLAYVLEPHDTAGAELRPQPNVELSPLCERLTAHARQVHELNDTVSSIIRRLDLPA